MKRALLLVGLAVTAGLVAVDLSGTLAGIADTETATASFEADLCHERSCQVIHAKALDDHDCNEAEWRFVITQVDADTAPRSIHVTWTDGDASVGLDRITGKTAHYRTSSYLDQDVENATARIAEGWSGQFNLGEGPCR